MKVLKGIFLALLSACFSASLAHAQNLLPNGDFESGFDGWTVTGNASLVSNASYPVSSGTAAVLLDSSTTTNANLSTTFSTVAGQAYIVSFDYAADGYATLGKSIFLTITDGGGHHIVRTKHSLGATHEVVFSTFKALFVAISSQTSIALTDTTFPATDVPGLLDNISVVPAPAFAFPGKYAGTAVIGRSFPGAISDSAVTNVKVAIDTAGQMFILGEPGDWYSSGSIDNQGDITLGDTEEWTGKASKVSHDEINFSVVEHTRLDNDFSSYPMTRTRVYRLHRVP